jgi:hypothetical protein
MIFKTSCNMFPVKYLNIACIAITAICLSPKMAVSQSNLKKRFTHPIINFDKDGKQITRFSTLGDAVDAHDGEIALFNGVYYLYGTSYDCGFEWGNKTAPFCGFKTYISTDMINWTDRGFLFDATTPVWQSRCDGKTYGCFRPHVIFNKNTSLYVLWINVYDNVSGYRVFTSKNPIGPFKEVDEPKLGVNSNAPAAGLNNGDHDTFVDDDGSGYLVYTDWRTQGSIVVEKLTDDYLTGTGQLVKSITNGKTEAPGMFKRNGIYYVVYSDPNCGYCSGTGAAYKTASSPLGPWSDGKRISDNSCGGQPSFVSTIKTGTNTIYLFGSDLWNNAAKNEALANYYWAPLSFAADGSINPLVCEQAYSMPVTSIKTITYTKEQNFTTHTDIKKGIVRSQSFTASATGILAINLTTFKTGYPDAPLQVELYKVDEARQLTGSPLATVSIPESSLSWSAKKVAVDLKMAIKKGVTYCLVIRSATTKGAYGFAYNDIGKPTGVESYSKDDGNTFSVEKNRVIRFDVHINK